MIRKCFVSNSSSTSFIVNFDHKIDDVREGISDSNFQKTIKKLDEDDLKLPENVREGITKEEIINLLNRQLKNYQKNPIHSFDLDYADYINGKKFDYDTATYLIEFVLGVPFFDIDYTERELNVLSSLEYVTDILFKNLNYIRMDLH